ncbi:MAG: hypothetical protein QXH91_06660 [Candidatus Bathyarchaeia archaeon]
MGKAALTTPLYISVAWILMISYQLFTQIAVTTVVENITLFHPSFGTWLASRIDMIVFIYAFAWVFVLSSVIPSAILGKERSVLVQFFVILTLTFLAFVIRDALTVMFNCETIDQIFSLGVLFHDLLLAAGYLSMPYLLMLILDVRSRTKRGKKEPQEKVTTA